VEQQVVQPQKSPSRRQSSAIGLLRQAVLLAAVSAAAGCAHLGTMTVDEAEARRELDAGIALYDQGEYMQAIRSLLTANELWRAPVPMRVTAQKYVAFSHCLLNRPQPCKQSFKDLLALKPDFDLTAAESGHPQWGSVFAQAKREAASGLVARVSR
jgi:hypothetical protein